MLVTGSHPPAEAVREAINQAWRSPCIKSKRGCSIYRRSVNGVHIIGTGYNGKPAQGKCDGSEVCRATCNKLCVHAEMRAIKEAHAYLHTTDLDDSYLVHAKVDIRERPDGSYYPELQTSGGPSCWQCSREVLDSCIGGVWLYHGQATTNHSAPGWKFYDSTTFHNMTIDACGLNESPLRNK